MKYKEFKEIEGIEEIESNVDLLNEYYKEKDFEYIIEEYGCKTPNSIIRGF